MILVFVYSLEILTETQGTVDGEGNRALIHVLEYAVVGTDDLETAPVDVKDGACQKNIQMTLDLLLVLIPTSKR